MALLVNTLQGGGAERVAVSLLESLSPGEETPLSLVLLENKATLEVPRGTPVFSLSASLRGDPHKLASLLLGAWRLRRLVREQGFTLVLSSLERANFVNVIARLLGSPHRTVVSEHTNPRENYRGRSLRNLAARQLVRFLYRRADAVIAVSEGVKKSLVDDFAVPGNLISVIHDPLDLDRIDRLAREDPKFAWFEEDVPIIVTTGRLEEPKGQAHLLRAFAVVRGKRPCRLVIVGEGSLRPDLERLAHSLAIKSDVALVGWQGNPYQYMARSTVFAFPSLWEGFSLALAEALACGLPAVSFDCESGPREILQGGRYGVLVPVGDEARLAEEILRLLNDPVRRQELSAQARMRARDFALPIIALAYRTVLEGGARHTEAARTGSWGRRDSENGGGGKDHRKDRS